MNQLNLIRILYSKHSEANLFEYIKKSYHNEEIYDLMYKSTTITNIINSTLFRDTGYKFILIKLKNQIPKILRNYFMIILQIYKIVMMKF